ncbi:MAG: hypothetical protein M3186_11430 [Actinomycetota bacterium]|nr:hypothetical protein [Actinomycetota bacterium]
MSDVLSLANITEQRAELLPARAVMSSLFVAQDDGAGLLGDIARGIPAPLQQLNIGAPANGIVPGAAS